jgi:hypothetical protein
MSEDTHLRWLVTRTYFKQWFSDRPGARGDTGHYGIDCKETKVLQFLNHRGTWVDVPTESIDIPYKEEKPQ